MAELASMFVRVGANVDNFNRGMEQVESRMNGFQRTMQGMGNAIGTTMKVVGAASGLAVAGLGVAVAKTGVEFNALKEAGLVPAVDVKIISVDATAGAFQAMLDGTLNVTVECNPLIAPQVYEAALAALNGESLPKWIPSIEGVFYMDDPNLKEIAAGRKY